MEPSRIIPLKQLRDSKYAVVLCYPKCDVEETSKRIQELRKLGVKALEFVGEKTVFNMHVLGKGYVGVVVLAHIGNTKVALKIRRVDADRTGMHNEAKMLKIANKVEVGPRLIGVSENSLLMEFVDGTLFPAWLESLKGRGTRKQVRLVLQDVLTQCWRLDQTGLDHGELSRASKHIIIDRENKPHIVDFESASTKRRVSNVTAISQYCLIGSHAAKTVQRKLGRIDVGKLKIVLRNYKQNHARENFSQILRLCELVRNP